MLDLIFVAAVLIFIFIGIKRGFVKSVMGVISLVLSVFLGIKLYAPFESFMKSLPIMSDMVETIKESFAATIKPVIEEATYGSLPEYISRLISPDIMEKGSDAISVAAAETVFSLVLIIIFILVIKLGLAMLTGMLGLATKLPVLKQLNKLMGAVTGFIGGMIFCYILASVFSVVAAYGVTWVNDQLQYSLLAKYFIENNIIINMLMK